MTPLQAISGSQDGHIQRRTREANSERLTGDAEAGRLGEIYRRQYHERQRRLLNMLAGSTVTAIRQPDGPVFREEREEGLVQLTKIFTAIQGSPVDIDPLKGVIRLRWAGQLFEVDLLDREGVLAVELVIA